MTYEDAFWGERPTGPDVIPRLVNEMQLSTDAFTRGKFAELLGEMGDASAVPFLIEELSHAEPDVRMWAVFALEAIGLPEGIRAAKACRETHHAEFE